MFRARYFACLLTLTGSFLSVTAPAQAADAPPAYAHTFETGVHLSTKRATDPCNNLITSCDLNVSYATDILGKMKVARFGWVRIPLLWRQVERTGALTDISTVDYMGAIEQLMDVATATHTEGGTTYPGLKVNLHVIDVPNWARKCPVAPLTCTGPGDTDERSGDERPASTSTYTAFVDKVLNYTAADGTGKVSAFEVWNEPNLTQFWSQCTSTETQPGCVAPTWPNPASYDPAKLDTDAIDEYAELVRAVHPVVKAHDATITVISGGLALARQLSVNWLKRAYFGDVASGKPGFKGYVDAIGIHPYSAPAGDSPYGDADQYVNGAYFGQLLDVREAIVQGTAAAQQASIPPLWVTEVGNSALASGESGPKFGNSSTQRVEQQLQAENFYLRYRRTTCEFPWVKAMFAYHAQDTAQSGTDDQDIYESNFGLYDENLAARQQYAMAQALNASGTTSQTIGSLGTLASGRTLFCSQGKYVPLRPEARIVNTAFSSPLAAHSTTQYQVAGASGLPEGAASVVVRVVAHSPAQTGTLYVYPYGQTALGTSALNFSTTNTLSDKARSNLITVQPGYGGRISVHNASGGTTHLALDVVGYYTSGEVAADGGEFAGVSQIRVSNTTLAANGSVTVDVAGALGVASNNVSAVAVTLTSVPVTGSEWGTLTAYETGTTMPTGSWSSKYEKERTIAAHAILPVSTSGQITVKSTSAGARRVIVDVTGWFPRTGSNGLRLRKLPPRRVYDSRTFGGTSSPIPGSGATPSTRTIQVRDLVPVEERGTAGADSVAVNVTVVSPGASGYLRTYHGSTIPAPSTHNFTVGEVRANTVYLPVHSDGTITIHNGSPSSTHVIVDVFGWFPRGT